jgi:formate-dependent nitrite reductase membrane component NrfD
MPDTEQGGTTETRGRWDGVGGVKPDGAGRSESERGGLAGLPPKSDGDKPDGSPAYYDLSLLQAPVWTPEVATYFFLGGLSSSAFSIARLADRLGGGRFRNVTQAGTAIAALAALPCAPLLIWDLGDRKRFHHMLRVWKPSSPMNLGSWTLTTYTLMGGVAAVRELLRFRRRDAPLSGAARVADEAAGLVADGLGVPLGLLLAAYTGVLLSTTSTPVWSRNSWIGALFSASAVSAGSGAVRLTLEALGQEGAATEALSKVETAARAAEAVCHLGFVAQAGPLARPLTGGEHRTAYLGGAVGAGIVLPEVLNRLPAPAGARRWLRIAAGLVGLVGGYALRSAFVSAGRPSAEDPDAARLATGEKGGAG